MPRVTPRKSSTSACLGDDAAIVDLRMGGHDHDQVGLLELLLERHGLEADLGQRRARAGRGRRARAPRSPSSFRILSAGDSRRSPTPGL